MRRDIKTGTDKHTFDKRDVNATVSNLNFAETFRDTDSDDEKRVVESHPVKSPKRPKPPIL